MRWFLAVACVCAPVSARAQPPPPPPPDDTDELVPVDDDEPRPTPAIADTTGTDDDDDDSADDDDDDDDEPGDASTEAPSAAGSGEEGPSTSETARRPFGSKYLRIEGYVQPQYTFIERKGARARFQREFGAQDTRAGLIFAGEPLQRWSYRIHVVVGAQIVGLVTGADLIDYEGDGTVDDLRISSRVAPGLGIEELWVNYKPIAFTPKSMEIIGWNIRVGQMRAPISRQNQIQNNFLLFPRRSNAVGNVFSSNRVGQTTLDPDIGAMTEVAFADERARITGGIFNGTGFAINEANERGPFYVTRLDIEPSASSRPPRAICDRARSSCSASAEPSAIAPTGVRPDRQRHPSPASATCTATPPPTSPCTGYTCRPSFCVARRPTTSAAVP
jgi:hypothetical protein